MDLNQSKSIIKPPSSEKIKAGLVVLNPGEEVGEHKTVNCEEIIVVIEGVATAIVKGESRKIEQLNTTYIPKNTLHNIINNTGSILKYYYIVSLH